MLLFLEKGTARFSWRKSCPLNRSAADLCRGRRFTAGNGICRPQQDSPAHLEKPGAYERVPVEEMVAFVESAEYILFLYSGKRMNNPHGPKSGPGRSADAFG